MRILVTGATGYVGSRLVTSLLAHQHHVIAATRKPERIKRFGWFDDVTPVALDAADPASVGAAFASCGPVDVVYYLVHAIGQPGFRDADKVAVANLAAAARNAGVRRIVYLGGFVPADEALSEHLTSWAEVAQALSIPDGPQLVWLGAAMIIGAGSTSFEMMRYVGDRFPLMPVPSWMDNPIDPISIRDVLHYLVAAADPDSVPAGAYDISGPDTTSYRELLKTYARTAGRWHTGLPVGRIDTGLASLITGVALPVPPGLAGELVESLDHPMVASVSDLRDRVPEPPGGLLGVDEAIALALADRSHASPRAINSLADPHHLANTDPAWAGGDALRIRQLARVLLPSSVGPTLGLVNMVPGPVAGALRTGLDILIAVTAKVRPA